MATPEVVFIPEHFERIAPDPLAAVIPLFPEAQQPTAPEPAMDSAQKFADLVARRNRGSISFAEYAEERDKLAQDVRARTEAAERGWRRAVHELYQTSWDD